MSKYIADLPSACSLQNARREVFALFFFNDTAPTEISPLSLHDALPISPPQLGRDRHGHIRDALGMHARERGLGVHDAGEDRKSTRLNSSHLVISYAVFCLKKKKHHSQLF